MNEDFLLQVCVRADNNTLRILSQTPLWTQVREVVQTQYFWYLRTQHLVGQELIQRLDRDWKQAYYSLASVFKSNLSRINYRAIKNDLVIEVLLELDYDLSVNNHYVLRQAISRGYIDTVRLLLRTQNLSSELMDELLELAVKYGIPRVVELLLLDPRIIVIPYETVITGARFGSEESLRLLLGDPRMKSTSLNEAAEQAYLHSHDKSVEILLADSRTDLALFNQVLPVLKRGRDRIIPVLRIRR